MLVGASGNRGEIKAWESCFGWRPKEVGKVFRREITYFFYKLDGKNIQVAGANTDKMD